MVEAVAALEEGMVEWRTHVSHVKSMMAYLLLLEA